MSDVPRKYQTFSPRFAAGFADGLIFMPLNYAYAWIADSGADRAVLALVYVFYSASFLTYSVFLHGRYGQTIGKRLCGIIVLDVSENPLSMKQAFIRDSPCIIALLVFLPFGLYRIWQGLEVHDPEQVFQAEQIANYVFFGWFIAEFVTMLGNPMRRAVHDYFAGSVVVREDEIGPSPFFS